MAITMDTLELEIIDNSKSAVNGLDLLFSALNKLKTATAGSAGLNKVSKALAGLATSFASLQNINLPVEKIRELTAALQPLTTLGKSSFNSLVTGLSKIGDVSKTLETMDMGKFATQIQRVATAMKPLADEAAKVYVGLKWLPSVVNKVIGANGKLSTSNYSAAKSYKTLNGGIGLVAAKWGIMFLAARRASGYVQNWIEKSNEYIENLNLFNVSMGKYAQEALDYAQQINKSMGVNMSEWIRNQGIIMDMSKSFGIAEGAAYKMSKALTQLSYDYSSLYNIKVSDSMLKNQSALAGEIEPVRRLGKDISVAKLQMVLFNMGIDASVEKLSQSNKAMLRTIALLQQSGSAMGDFARTLDSPANQLRILNARIQEFSRAMGNLLMPMISAALPYLIAFVQVVTEAANALAVMAGFELPKFDYSGLENAGSSIGGITDGLEDAAAAAKKFKGMRAGFDELNVIQQKEDKGIGGLDISGSLMPELDRLTKEYDEKFANAIKSKTEEIVDAFKNKFNEIKDAIEPFMPIIEGVGAALATAFALKWLAKALAGFKKLGAVAGILLALKKAAVTAFAVFTISGGGIAGFAKGIAAFFSSLWISFKAFMQNLSPFAKFAVTIVGLVAVFTTVYDSVKKLTLGSLSFEDAMKNIIPVVGLVGAALYAMLGPWGLVLTGVTAVVAAIKAYSDAQDELRQKLVEETFFDNQGIAIGDLADQYSRAAEAIASTYDPILQMKEKLDSARTSVDSVTSSLGAISFGIENGLYSAQEKLPEIEQQFSEFRDNMETILDGTYEVIVRALSGGVGDAITSAGESLSEYTGLILSAKGNLDEQMLELTNQFKQLQDDFKSGKITQDDYSDSLSNIVKSMEGLSLSQVAEEVNNLSTKMGTLVDIDFGADTSFSELQKALDGFVSSSDASKEKITTAYSEIKASIEQLKLGATTEQDRIKFDELLGFTDEALKTDLAKIDALAAQFAGQMQGNIVSEVQKQYDAAMANWDNLGWFAQTFKYGGNQAGYVESALKDYKSNIVIPMTDKMKKTFGSAFSDDDIWAVKSVEAMMSQLFATIQTESASGNFTKSSTVFSGNVKTSIDTALQNAGFDASGKYVVDGLAKGIADNTSTATDALSGVSTAMGTTFKEFNQIKSPSKLYEQYGIYLLEGLANGIISSSSLVTIPLQALLDDMLSSIKEFTSNATTEFENLLSDIRGAMREISNLKMKGIEVSSSGAKVKGYASGGFPQSGEMFVARENGIPEMVGAIGNRTAVANNDQIVKGISQGVAEGNTVLAEALSRFAQQVVNEIKNNRPVAYIGDKDIFSADSRAKSSYSAMVGVP